MSGADCPVSSIVWYYVHRNAPTVNLVVTDNTNGLMYNYTFLQHTKCNKVEIPPIEGKRDRLLELEQMVVPCGGFTRGLEGGDANVGLLHRLPIYQLQTGKRRNREMKQTGHGIHIYTLGYTITRGRFVVSIRQ